MMGKLTDSEIHNLRNAERLTKCNDSGGISVADLLAALKKLAAYEDEDADGRLVRLPVKIGDTVYTLRGGDQRIATNKIREVEVRKLELDQYDFCFTVYSTATGYFHVGVMSCGKSYFLTRAEAETALKAMEATQ